MAGASPKTKKPQRAWEERALQRARQQVLRGGHHVVRAARELVADGGLEAVTLRALLKRTRLARRAFYRHFESMDDVLLALFEDTMASGAARLRAQLERVDEPVAALEQAVRTIASGALSSRERIFMLAMTHEHIRLAENRPEELHTALAPMNELIADLLRAAMKTRAVRAGDATKMAEIIHALISTQVHRNLYRGADDTSWIDALWDFCLGGIGRGARRAAS